jgi:FlaA1/EpsC-like NDP-sugar epimerase
MNNKDKELYEIILERKIDKLDFNDHELNQLRETKILITGAGGSIGSAIVKMLDRNNCLNYVATDRDETALHSLSLSIKNRALFDSNQFYLMDIRDLTGVERIMQQFKPLLVIHAAALKHLSALEQQPREAAFTNILGTRNVAVSALKAGVEKFVNISTDKAANPKSILGLSKSIAENLIKEVNLKHQTQYKSCRFGNVFNSRGSVIETFTNQIRKGEPVTLTSKKMLRYFMHENEAAFLTLKSSLLPTGDLYVFEMHEPVPITRIIQNLEKYFGIRSKVIETGMRNGEKLEEQLVGKNEKIIEETDDGIKIIKSPFVKKEFEFLHTLIEQDNLDGLTAEMDRILKNG